MFSSPIKITNSFYKLWGSSENFIGSCETSDSLSIEAPAEKPEAPLVPTENEFLFECVPAETSEFYQKLYTKLSITLNTLEEVLESVNIRDDCCIKAKNVCLRLPARKKTLPSQEKANL
jgi:hypothetical protein